MKNSQLISLFVIVLVNERNTTLYMLFVVNYTLKNQNGVLGKVSLYKASYKLGEDVIGTLDLTSATIACLQVTIGHECNTLCCS